MKKNERIKELENLIKKYQASYYDGEAEISDSEFDLLWDELKNLAPDSQVLKDVGTGIEKDGFTKARHLMPMGSQEKASNPKEFLDWAVKIKLIEKEKTLNDNKSVDANTMLTNDKARLTKPIIVQYKLDGASLELQYEKGIFIRAVTRGDGIIGDEITYNARRMKGTVEKLNTPFSGGIRGEVIMTNNIWKTKYPDKANCRNAANGIMRRKDGQGCEDLTFIVYDACIPDNKNYFKDEIAKIEWLKKQGFETVVTKIFDCTNDAQTIIEYRNDVYLMRDSLPFDIDGLVIKDIVIDTDDLKRARPEKQIAFKFDLETAFSILREVEWSESGATYTPIGIIDPVRLAGTTVKRANLNNPDMIRLMKLKIGSVVSVVKRGEIIPKIEGLALHSALAGVSSEEHSESDVILTEIKFPQVCNTCGSVLIDAGTKLFCPNNSCPKRLLHRLIKWVSVLDIRELGEKLITQLFEKKRVLHIYDLYTLKTDELAEYERMGELSAAKVIRHITTKREISLSAFTAGFDLENVAETTMEKITQAGINTLSDLRKANVSDLSAIHGIGEITASVIIEGLKECANEMDKVLETGIITIALPPQDSALAMKGLSFCFTGELKSMKRSEAEEKVKSLGAQAKSSVVKGLSYLVTNDPSSGSSKNKKANELCIPIINEERFLELLSETVKLDSHHPEQNSLF